LSIEKDKSYKAQSLGYDDFY